MTKTVRQQTKLAPQLHGTTSRGASTKNYLLTLIAVILLSTFSLAQLPIPPSTQFDIVGFLQEATVTNAGDAHSGGTLRVNGHTVTVPRETIVILPANALTWQELFATAPSPYTGVATGMALADVPAPLTTYEVHVVGNRVGDTYIAGLVNISQQDLNSGAGFINFIDYATGEMRVGGQIVVDGAGNPVLSATNPGARVRINDPVGRYGRSMTRMGALPWTRTTRRSYPQPVTPCACRELLRWAGLLPMPCVPKGTGPSSLQQRQHHPPFIQPTSRPTT